MAEVITLNIPLVEVAGYVIRDAEQSHLATVHVHIHGGGAIMTPHRSLFLQFDRKERTFIDLPEALEEGLVTLLHHNAGSIGGSIEKSLPSAQRISHA